MIHPTIIHPDLAFTRCIKTEGRVTRCMVTDPVCKACGKHDGDTGWPQERWLVRGFRLDAGEPVRIPGMHLVCHTCLIMWDD